MTMRTGDTVKHVSTGEKWTVGWADERFAWMCGWPETTAPKDLLLVVKRATDEEHWKLVREIAEAGTPGSLLCAMVDRYLESHLSAECMEMMHL